VVVSSERFLEFFDSLDKGQFRAAIEIDGPLLVEAAPGGGKTRTLVAKALAASEKQPVHIITFTTSAAEEINNRIEPLMREVLTGDWKGIRHIGTLHSWCLGYLRSTGFRGEVIDELALAEVMHDVNKRLRLRLSHKRMASLSAGAAPESHHEVQFVRALDSDMVENGLISYDGILRKALEHLQAVKAHRTDALFLIDEVQDSSPMDLAIYDVLRESGAELWLVGDLQQAIYSFRHEQKANVWKWWGALPMATLPTNYRSSLAVIKALNQINAEFVPRVEIVPAEGAPQGEVVLRQAASEAEQLEQLYNRVLNLLDRGYPDELAQIAVLCRTNRECDLVGTILKGRGLSVRQKKAEAGERAPQTLWAALGFFLQPQSDWMARRYLRVLGNDGIEAQKSAIKAMKPIGQMLVPALFAIEQTPFEWFSNSWMDRLQVPKKEQGWFLERLDQGWTDLGWDDILMRLFEAPVEQERGHGITVTTVHAAKGREWDHVLMPFCDQLSYRPKNGIEEERVFFVGASRARKTLAFFYSERRVGEWSGEIEVAMYSALERLVDAAKKDLKPKRKRKR